MAPKKLHLVLDLDHTLLHTTTPPPPPSCCHDPDRGLFKIDALGTVTKLRPRYRQFLHQLSTMYDLHIFTMGDREYTSVMVSLLDPFCLYFSSGDVFSRSDCREVGLKNLDVLHGHGADATNVVILDDTWMVWRKNLDNLIHIKKFEFSGFDPRAPLPEEDDDDEGREAENDGDVLEKMFDVLAQIHVEFVNGVEDDVREVMKKIRKQTLSGCRIVISRGMFPAGARVEEDPLWSEVEKLGAEWSAEVGAEVTHVVSNDLGSEEAEWAVANGKFLVRYLWLEDAYDRWERPEEEEYHCDIKTCIPYSS